MFLFYKNIIIGLFLHVIYCFNSDVDNDYNTAIINKISNISRRQDAIPIINVRGSHFEVGHMVGKTFGSVIQEFVKSYYPLNDYLNIYKTAEGRKTYQDTLNAVNMYFPQYLVELKGVADGSGVEFHKLFLIHIDDVILPGDSNSVDAGTGCSSVMVDNVYGQFIGHTEDALKETVNHFYILNAHIIPSHEEIGLGGKFKAREERWEAMTYAGSLSGYASGHNYHGLVFSINTIFAKYPHKGKIPRVFLTRALLASNADLTEIENILKNEGVGTADAFNVNVGFLNQNNIGHQKLYSIEVTPSSENNAYSDVNTQEVNKIFFHTNRLLHTKSCEELRDSGWNSSVARESRFDEINCKHQIEKPEDILKLLGDKKNEKWRIFRDDDSDFVNTINLGLFDLMNKTWKLWTNNPTNHSDILIELPLEFLPFNPATEPGECK